MDNEKKFRVIELPTGALVIQKKKGNKWKKDFSISPIEKNTCSICGHPLSFDEKCSYHNEIKDLHVDFSLCYGGYYQSDLKNKPLNEYSERIRQFNTTEIELFLKIPKINLNISNSVSFNKLGGSYSMIKATFFVEQFFFNKDWKSETMASKKGMLLYRGLKPMDTDIRMIAQLT